MNCTISIEKSELKEYLYSGLGEHLIDFPSIQIENLTQSRYGEYFLSLSGSQEDLTGFLSYMGFEDDEIPHLIRD